MKFTVLWKPVAEQRLAHFWLIAPDRAAITAAANSIDKSLARDPLNFGESRLDQVRVAFEGPLGVLFEVDEQDRKVSVLDVWRCRPPS